MIIRKHKTTPAASRSTRSHRARRTLGRVLILATAAALNQLWLGVTPALAGRGVKVENVASGSADITRSGAVTTIRAADRTVINYSSFNVARNETVRFVQPSETARVLNRINAKTPSLIDGSIRANGVVYFVNRAGVIFGPNATIESSRFVAAAGAMSDRDFITGVDRFSLTGPLVNHGTINADAVALVGRTVENVGQVTGRSMVTLATGDAVYMRDVRGEGMMVNVTPHAQAPTATRSLGVGDAAGVALLNRGSIRSQNINVAGSGGVTQVSGRLDAANPRGAGGQIHISGEKIAVLDANIDASGATGGGQIYVGGGPRGDGSIPNAINTIVDARSTLRSDATQSGAGGTIIVWADNATGFAGTASAQGISRGGFIEVSGYKRLIQDGNYHLGARDGVSGTLLFDPQDIIITGGTSDGSDDPDAASNLLSQSAIGQVLFADVGTADPFVVFESELEATDADIILEATSTITVSGAFGGNDVTLQPNRSLTLRTRNDSGDAAAAGGNAIVTTGVGFTTSGTGTITIEAGATAVTPQTANLVLGPLTTAGAGVSVSTPSGSITLGGAVNAGTGDVTLTAPITSTVSIGSTITGDLVSLQGLSVSASALVSSTDLVVVTGGAFDFNNFSATDSVRIQAGGNVTQTQPITTVTLGVRTSGAVTLTNAANDVNTFAASGTNVSFTDVDDLAVGSVSTSGGFTPLLGGVSGTGVNLTAGSLTATSNVTATDLVIVTTAGAFDWTSNYSGTSSVRIQSSGNVTQSASIATTTLGVRSSGTITLAEAANDVNTFAASGTSITFVDADDLSIGSVSAVGGFTPLLGGVSGTGVNLTAGSLSATSNVAVTDLVIVTTTDGVALAGVGATGSVRIQSAGDVTQSSSIISPILGVRSSGAVTLTNAANDVNTFAASGTNVSFTDVDDLAVGSVSTSGGFTPLLGGVSGTGVNLTAGSLSATSNVAATDLVIVTTASAFDWTSNFSGTSSVRIQSSGNVTQSASIATTTLGVRSSGAVTLTDAANDVNTFAASGTSISFVDVDDLAIGSVSSVGGFAPLLSGVSGAGVNLTAGSLSATSNVAATDLVIVSTASAFDWTSNYSGTSSVRIQSSGNITQSAAIGTGVLGARTSGGSITLTNANNAVTTFAGSASVNVSYTDLNALSIGTVSASGGFTATTGVSGASHNIATGSGNLAIGSAITASGTTRLTAGGTGNVTQAAAISSPTLGVRAGGSITLTNASNAVTTFAAEATGGTLSFRDTNGFTVGNVTAAGAFATAATGVLTNGADILLQGAGNISLNSQINALGTAGSAGDIGIVTTSGQITQPANAVGIRANMLAVSAPGNIALDNSIADSNDAATFAAYSTGGAIRYSGLRPVNGTFTIGSASAADIAGLPNVTDPLTSASSATIDGVVVAGNNTITLSILRGNISLERRLNANNGTGTGGVNLQNLSNVAQGGVISQPSAATSDAVGITANTLAVRSTGSVALTRATPGDVSLNAISNLAIQSTTSGSVSFRNSSGLSLVQVLNANDFLGATGVSTVNQPILLRNDAGTLAVNAALSAGTGGTIRLRSAGEINQTTSGAITASELGFIANGAVNLGERLLGLSVNSVSTVAGQVTAANQIIGITSQTGGDLGIGSVAAATLFEGVTGLITNSGNVTVVNDLAGIAVNNPITAGAGTVRLASGVAGSITQTSTGTISASGLGVISSAGSVTLTSAANAITTLAGSADGDLSVTNTTGLTVGQVAADDFWSPTQTGVTATDSARLTATTITANQNVSAADLVLVSTNGAFQWTNRYTGTNSVRIQATGNVTQTASIITPTLGIRSSGGSITLTDTANNVTTFAASASSTVRFVDTNSLTLGQVTPLGDFATTTTGVTATTVDLTLGALAAGTLTIDQPATATDLILRNVNGALIWSSLLSGTNSVRLEASGNITQAAPIVTTTLAARSTGGSVTLTNASNNVTTLAGSATTGGASFSYRDTNALAIGSVAALGSFASAANGISADTINLTSGTMTASQSVAGDNLVLVSTGGAFEWSSQFSGTDSVRIQATGNVTQTAPIVTTQLGVRSSGGAVTLQNISNNVTSFIGSASGALSFVDANTFDVASITASGNFSPALDVLATNNNDITLAALTGDIDVGAPINAGTGTVRLSAGAAIDQSSPITASAVGIRSIGVATLDHESNDVGLISGDVGGLVFASAASGGLEVGSVGGTNLFTATTGLTSAGGVIVVSTIADLTLAQPILATGQAVRLQAGPISSPPADVGPRGVIATDPSITQADGALITANSLAARALGDVILCLEGVNVASVIDIRTGAGRDDSVRFVTQQPVFDATDPAVADSGIFNLIGTGTPGRRVRAFAGAYVIGAEGNLPGGTLLIDATGNVTQSAAVTATTVAVDTTGSITLDEAANAFSNYASSSTNSAVVRSTLDLTLIDQAAALCFDSVVTGVRSVNGSVTLRSNGALFIDQPLSAANDVGLVAGTTITQNGIGIITAGRTLGVRGTTVTLQNASNDALNFTANTSGTLAYTDANALNIDELSGDVLSGYIDTAGITAPTVALNVGGALTQSSAGVINAASLGIRSAAATLESNNDVDSLAALTTGALSFRDTDGLEIGDVSTVGTFAAIDGIVSTNQNVTLNAGGSLELSEALNAGTGTVRLAAGDEIEQTGDGIITADTLGVAAVNTVELTLDNAVENFAGASSAAGEAVRFNSTSDLVIGTVAPQGTMFSGVTGVTTNNGESTLASDGILTLDSAVNVGTAVLRLQGGSITQTANGLVTAGTLGARVDTSIALELAGADVGAIDTRASTFDSILLVNQLPVSAVVTDSGVFDSAVGSPATRIRRFDGNYIVNGAENLINGTLLIHATGNITQTAELRARNLGLFSGGSITLPSASNNITTIAAFAPSGVAVRSSAALTTAAQATNRIFQPTTSPVVGISTTNSDIALLAPTLTLTEALQAGSANVRLASGVGGISQTGVITAGALGINTTGPVVLLGDNAVDVISGSATGAGLIDFASTEALTVGSLTADANSLFSATTGITTAGGGALLVSTAGISITDAINVGSGIVRLQAGGDIAQSAVITAGSVGARTSNGAITLDVANVVDLFAAESGSGGLVSIADSDGFDIGTVAARGPFAQLAGLTTTGAVLLDAQGANGITQTASITGNRLSITSLGPINLPLLTNTVGTVAFDTTGGGFVVYRNASALTVGTVAESGLAGITSPAGNVLLGTGAGAITLTTALNASANAVRIVSPVSITQSGDGVITASVLGVDAPIVTLNLNNLVATLGARATTLSYTNAVGTPITLGAVSADPDGFFTAINGTTASIIDFNLGQFTINQPLTATTSLQLGSTDLIIASDVTTPTLTINHVGNVLLGDAADAAAGTLSNAELARLIVSGAVSIGSTGTISINDASIAQAWSGLTLTSAVTMLGDFALTNASTFLTFNAPIIVGAASTISTNNATIFTSAIDGAEALSLDAGFGRVSLGTVGGTTPLSSLSIRSESLVLNGDVTATGDISLVPSAGDVLVSNGPLLVGGGSPIFNVTNDDLARLTTPGNVILGSGSRGVSFTLADAITFASKGYTLRVNGPTTLAGNTSVTAGAGGVIFANTVDSDTTARNLTVTGAGDRTFLAAVGGTRPLNTLTTGSTTTAVDSVSSVTTIGAQTYGANTINVNGMLNTTGTLLADGLASIVFTGTDVRVNESQTTNAFAVGDLEAIVVPNGSLSIFGQTVAVGDVSVLNNLTITSPAIAILRRAAISPRQLPVVRDGVGTTIVPGVGQAGVVAADRGMDFVAGGAITFSSVPTLSGSGPLPIFAVPNPPPGQTPVGTSFIRQEEAVNLLLDARAGNVADGARLDLVSSGNATIDASSAIAAIVDFEAPPVDGPRGVFADLLDVLRRMGINARPAILGELLSQIESSARFESFVVAGSADARDVRATGLTVDRRLLQDAVFGVISAVEQLGILLDVDNRDEVDARFAEHRSLFEEVVAEYQQANGIEGELSDEQLNSLRDQILARPADDATRQSLEGFSTLIRRLDQLGLTARELDSAHATLLDDALPQDPALTRSQMLTMLRGN